MLSRTDCYKKQSSKILGTARILDKEVHKSNASSGQQFIFAHMLFTCSFFQHCIEMNSFLLTLLLGLGFLQSRRRDLRIEYQISLEWTLLHILSDSKTKNLCWVLLPLKKTLRKFHKKYVLCTVCIGIRVTHCNRYPIALLTLEATQAKYWVALYFQQRAKGNIFTHFPILVTIKKVEFTWDMKNSKLFFRQLWHQKNKCIFQSQINAKGWW